MLTGKLVGYKCMYCTAIARKYTISGRDTAFRYTIVIIGSFFSHVLRPLL